MWTKDVELEEGVSCCDSIPSNNVKRCNCTNPLFIPGIKGRIKLVPIRIQSAE